MFNPLKNPFIVRTVLDKAQEELNEQLRYRKQQFNNPKLYMWVEIDKIEQIPYICLRDESGQNIVRMTAEELLQDDVIKKQLQKIPAIVRPFIKLHKIIPEMNILLTKKLGVEKFIKVWEGKKSAYIELWEGNTLLKEGVSLYDLFE